MNIIKGLIVGTLALVIFPSVLLANYLVIYNTETERISWGYLVASEWTDAKYIVFSKKESDDIFETKSKYLKYDSKTNDIVKMTAEEIVFLDGKERKDDVYNKYKILKASMSEYESMVNDGFAVDKSSDNYNALLVKEKELKQEYNTLLLAQ